MTEPVSVKVHNSFWTAYRAGLRVLIYNPIALALCTAFPVLGFYLIYLFVKWAHSPTAGESLLVVFSLGFPFFITALAQFMLRLKNRLAKAPYTYTIDDEGICTATDMASSDLKWSAIVRVVETKRYLFFFIAPTRAFYLPVAQLRLSNQLEQLRELVKSHVSRLKGSAW